MGTFNYRRFIFSCQNTDISYINKDTGHCAACVQFAVHFVVSAHNFLVYDL
jgi:hypothetical protein